MAPITTIVHFQVPDENIGRFLPVWQKAREKMVEQLGIVSALELAATLGLLAGLLWWPLGAAAVLGSTIYFVGAVITHLRARDYAIVPAAVLLLASAAALALILASS